MIIPIITGPTSSGKSSIAYNVGLITNKIEVISADAFQVYKGLNIGTAKISLQEREKVTHHLIDIMEPNIPYSAGIFVEQAEKLIEEILLRNKIPVIAGGTGLYIKSLTDGLFNCPKIDNNIRLELQKELEKDGISSMYNKLVAIDSDYAEKISNNDPVRIIRALEVYYGLGITFTKAHKIYSKKPKYEYTTGVLWLERNVLYNNINKRTEEMWESGWPKEVEKLLNLGYNKDCAGFRAIGYKIIADYLENKIDKERAVYEIAKETRHFAKRQLTWFRNKENVVLYNDKNKLENNLIELINGERSVL